MIGGRAASCRAWPRASDQLHLDRALRQCAAVRVAHALVAEMLEAGVGHAGDGHIVDAEAGGIQARDAGVGPLDFDVA